MTDGNEQRILTSRAGVPSFYAKLNREWHKAALSIFMVVVLAHWAEHLVQACQIYLLHWPVPASRGILGLWFPWLVKSEILHYLYALVILAGLWGFRTGFQERSYTWWMLAFGLQFWHHIEHALLQAQALLGQNLFGAPVPMSIVQLWVPRVELHMLYNTIVFIPLVLGLYFHMRPSERAVPQAGCSCAWQDVGGMARAA